MELLSAISKLPREKITVDSRLTLDLGLDSIQFMELLASLEDRFPIRLEVEDIRPELFFSVGTVLEFVQERLKDD
ncbi:acyl carrier protein [Paenibacillus mesotrionivorans]|uniref:Acyl carrier protein n=1 Tax=Paenibacillus mesotrionivorans TaxID=3160968 RepID=A0ACC7NUM9_9BACL